MAAAQHLVIYAPVMSKKPFYNKVRGLFNTAIVAYWPLRDASGAAATDVSGNARNGVYTGVDLANTAGPKGGKVPLFDGANDKIAISAAAAAFNGVAGTVIVFAKMLDGTVWGDGANRTLFRMAADAATNGVNLYKGTTSNLIAVYTAGGTTESITKTGMSTTAWFMWAITWDKNAGADGEVKAYFNGVQEGSTQTALGIWSGVPTSDRSFIGAQTAVPGQVMNGWIGDVVLLNRAATPAEIASVLARDNIVATQFHPEKSQDVGLRILKNFAEQK